MMNDGGMMDCMMGMGWIMGLFWILLIALVAWGLYRLFTTRGSSTSARETPLEALQRRYAEGGLSTDEYEERRRTLQNRRGTP